ncbi:MAG: ATP-binding protein [Candidatus Dormibacteraceae bacterium]
MLQVTVLGEKAIVDDGAGPLAASSRSIALVAFLALHAGAPQSRQRIAGLFWPDSTDAQSLTNLRRELHHLRRILGQERSLAATPSELCWRDGPTCRVDVRAFTLERAAALAAAATGDDAGVLLHGAKAVEEYKGDLLPGAEDDWAVESRAELERQCVGLCELISAAGARSGDLSTAAQAARRRIQLAPLEESGYRTLMELQADLGERAAAVSTYHRCAALLERELGVVPDPDTQRALQRLLARGEPAPDRRSPVGPLPARVGVAAPAFVGRAGELERLRDLWDAALGGRPGLVLVHGGPGVGKTRLVAEIAEMVRRQGAAVASSQCFGTTGRLALAPVADWLRTPALQSSIAALDAAWRAEIDRLLPSGGRRRSGGGARAMVDAWQRHRFFEGLARALLAVPRPLLLVLDNLQWCDEETLEFLAFCLKLAPDAQLQILVTLRDDAPSRTPDLAGWRDRVRAIGGSFTEIALGPFEVAETGRLAEAVLRRPLADEVRDLLQATTGGFPLHVVEAVRGGSPPVPGGLPAPDLTAVLHSRFEQTSPQARDVARLAAAVGRDFTLDLLTEASDLDSDAVVAAVDELWRRRILRVFGDGYDFSHDLLREAAYVQISPPRRWLLHRRIAQSLELLHSGEPDGVAAQVAAQYARGGRPDRAAAHYGRAAELAAGMFAHAEAIRLHQEALRALRRLPEGRDRDRRELQVREAMAAPLNARYGYSSPELQETLERALVLARTLNARESTLKGMVALWTSRYVQGRNRESYELARRALTALDEGSSLSCLAHFAVGGSAIALGRPAEGVRHLELAGSLGGGAALLSVGTRPDVHALAWSAHGHWLLGHDELARACGDEAVRLARAIDHPYSLAVALAYGALTDQLRLDLPRLVDRVAELRELCERYDFAYYRDWGLVLDGWSRPGDSGLPLAQEGIASLRSHGSFARMPYWLCLLADLWVRHGRLDAARATVDAARAAALARDDLWWFPEAMRLGASLEKASGAIPLLREAAESASAQGSVALVRRCERDLAERGDLPRARVPHR